MIFHSPIRPKILFEKAAYQNFCVTSKFVDIVWQKTHPASRFRIIEVL